MHFSIPDTEEVQENGSSPFTIFNLYVNGVHHCSLRYRQLHSFHEQLKKEYGGNNLPPFPPKKLLSLTPNQLEDRRLMLERYIQALSQNPVISNSDVFINFLLNAQRESQGDDPEKVSLDLYLMNGHKIPLSIMSTDQTDDVLEALSAQIEIPDEFVYYFGLFLLKKEEDGETMIVRKLQEFEAPYVSLKSALNAGVHRIVLRKSFWEPSYEDDLLDNRVTMNLLYVQAVSDIERNWVITSKEHRKQLDQLQQKGSKKEYLKLAQTLKYYGYIQFKPCHIDYPRPNTRALVATGNKELNVRLQEGENMRDVSFKVTRMRCWRITTTMMELEDGGEAESSPFLELSFEYLVAKDTLKWITISSEQAILLSMSLQGMVDELIQKKQGRRIRRPGDRKKGALFKKEISMSSLKSSPSSPTEDRPSPFGARSLDTNVTDNDAFDGIGDDDL